METKVKGVRQWVSIADGFQAMAAAMVPPPAQAGVSSDRSVADLIDSRFDAMMQRHDARLAQMQVQNQQMQVQNQQLATLVAILQHGNQNK